jgi:hypothetical protein
MNKITHIISNHIFILATSLAMLVHSTWTFATLFAGEQPVIDGSLQQWIQYLMWVLPALLVANAIDVGQIQTSIKLSQAAATRQRVTLGITFVTLATAGYYLQWFHLAHHIPQLEFGAGLSPDMAESLVGLKNMSIFIIPALLPLSTILYTLSSAPTEEQNPMESIAVKFPMLEPAVWTDDTLHIHIPDLDDTEPIETVAIPAEIEHIKTVARRYESTRSCDHCGKQMKNPRSNQKYCNESCRKNAYKARL